MVEADEGTAEMKKAFVDVGPPFIADRQPSEAPQPGQRAFDHPAVATQLLATLDPLARNPDLDVPAGQRLATARDVIGLVRVQLGWSFAWTTTRAFDWLDGVDQGLEVDTVMTVGRSQQNSQRDALTFDDQMVFAAGLAFVGGIPADLVAPLFAGRLALSRLARLQSMQSASPN